MAAAAERADYSAMDTVSESTVFQLPPVLLCRSSSTSVTSPDGVLAMTSLNA